MRGHHDGLEDSIAEGHGENFVLCSESDEKPLEGSQHRSEKA